MRRLSLLLALLAAGCTPNLLAPSGPLPAIYTLSAPAKVAPAAPQANWQLLINMPDAILDLNTSRIATAPSPSRIDYYANVAWADRPSAMLQKLLLRSFDESGRIAAVQRQSGGLKADFELQTDIEDFEIDSDSAKVHVRLTEKLVRARDRTIVASRVFEKSVAVSGALDNAITGFDAALADLLPQIVDWTLTQGSRSP